MLGKFNEYLIYVFCVRNLYRFNNFDKCVY